MVALTPKEREALLILLKDFTNFYNANALSKILNISHVGAQKIGKRLLKENILISKRIGKSIVYRLNLDDEYVRSLAVFLLADEANHFRRWKEEFRELFKKSRIVMLFGSAIKNYASAADIDIMVVMEHNHFRNVNAVLKKKQEMLPKKLHVIKLTSNDLLENLKKKNKAMIGIAKNAIILHGQETYVGLLQHVTRF